MPRRNINIFGTSFLDLLSGALAAVIILFIIVPKMSYKQQNMLKEIERLNIRVEELDSLMGQLQNSIPQEAFEEIQQNLKELQNIISELTEETENLQKKLASATEENQRLRDQISQLNEHQQENERLRDEHQQENERLRDENEQMRKRIQELEEKISDGKFFGLNAKIGVVCMWPENVDVDLYVKDLSTGSICYYGAMNQPFGSLMEDVRSHASSDDDRYELFYQKKIIPGFYQIFVNVYAGRNNINYGEPTNANINGYVIMNPGKSNQIKIVYRNITITQKGIVKDIGKLTVTDSNISLEQ